VKKGDKIQTHSKSAKISVNVFIPPLNFAAIFKPPLLASVLPVTILQDLIKWRRSVPNALPPPLGRLYQEPQVP